MTSKFPNLSDDNSPAWWKAATAALLADIPVVLWAPPGVGKTARVASTAAANGVVVETLIGSQIDPTDLARPVVWEGKVKLSPAPFAERLAEAKRQGIPAMLFLDEYSTSPPAVQAAMLRVIHDRQIGDLDLTGVRILAAANRVELGAGAYDMAAPTSNRFVHIDAIVDPFEWAAGELGGWGSRSRTEEEAAASATIVSFINHRPSALLQIPKDDGAAGQPWASPRSWSHAARVMARAPDDASRSLLLTGAVGGAAAAEFLAWLVQHDLPSPQSVLSGEWVPDATTRGDITRAAVEGAISLAVLRMQQPRTPGSADPHAQMWDVLKHTMARPDVAVPLAKLFADACNTAKVQLMIPDDGAELLGTVRKINRMRMTATGGK
jgi:hypothetical protein